MVKFRCDNNICSFLFSFHLWAIIICRSFRFIKPTLPERLNAIIKWIGVGSWRCAGLPLSIVDRMNFYLWHLINILINCGQLSVRIELHLPSQPPRPRPCRRETSRLSPTYRHAYSQATADNRQLYKCRTLRLRHKHFSMRRRNVAYTQFIMCVSLYSGNNNNNNKNSVNQYIHTYMRTCVCVCTFNIAANCNLRAVY